MMTFYKAHCWNSVEHFILLVVLRYRNLVVDVDSHVDVFLVIYMDDKHWELQCVFCIISKS